MAIWRWPHPLGVREKISAAAETTSRELVTTVDDKLRYTFEHLVRYVNAEAQRDAANQVAKADVVVEGRVILRDMPGTWLLGMEKRMAEWRNALVVIPTLAPGERWVKDDQRGKNVWTHEAKKSIRTRKTVNHKILVQPTKEHPAQIEKWNEDVPCGTWIQTEWAGMMTPAEKSALLARFDALSRAIVEARMRANCVEVPDLRPGDALAAWIIDGKLP